MDLLCSKVCLKRIKMNITPKKIDQHGIKPDEYEKIIALIKKGVESFPDASVSGGNGPSK